MSTLILIPMWFESINETVSILVSDEQLLKALLPIVITGDRILTVLNDVHCSNAHDPIDTRPEGTFAECTISYW